LMTPVSRGVIDRRTHGDLTILRRIRNEFAHHIHGLSFDHERIRHRVESFECVKLIFEEPEAEVFASYNTTRRKFDRAVAWICSQLAREVDHATRLAYRSPLAKRTFRIELVPNE
jgi:hypothetical protein